MFIPTVPLFELYKKRLTNIHKKIQVSTDVIGIKCSTEHSKLLREFFLQLASPASYEKQIGVFILTSTVNMLGPENYTNLICDNNAFLHNVVTVPLGDFQHAMLDIPFSMDSSTDIEQTTLLDLIEDQPWCISVECTSINNKVLLTVFKDQLHSARQWVGHSLPALYEQHISDKLDVTTMIPLVPRRLDKPVLTVAVTAYAEKLKQQTTVTTTTTTKINPL